MAEYWQVATGAWGRDFSEISLKYGLAMVGGDDNVATMREVRPGDRIILKGGRSVIKAVGVVEERDGSHRGEDDKEWLRDFDGWDLPAYCKVIWHLPKKPLEVTGLTRATIQRVWKRDIQTLAETILKLPPKGPIAPEPEIPEKLGDEEILTFLIEQGFRPGAAEDLTSAFARIRRLARYYYGNCKWSDIREHETRTFLIIPLLLALGWAEQQIKIELSAPERGRIDVAGFSKPYQRDQDDKPNNSDCVLILESKGFNSGLDFAGPQAKSYAKYFPSCEVIVVTNGYCYKTYKRKSRGGFSITPSAYLNLLKPKKAYPLDPERVGGGLEVLECLLPASWR